MKTTASTITQPVLVVDSHHGTYTPQIWLQTVAGEFKAQLTPEERQDLRNPEGEFYWDTWDTVLNREFKFKRQKGHFEQTEDGDVFFVPACYARSKEYRESFTQN